ncbi:energy-coupling factor transporter transmembrane component T family protein [Catellicoccus marimammalium]|uniref:Energy-coupling factor transporter transmembrane protein EcfT n=1 Tax=Catellicoccus marimammalium M35/04/3 TaxID=1234409 RepID=K8Z814_9ENTE|nr:energy-coupling factor transporter transmembrane component T [Catellicoccus marimammalium]EKU27139.1 Transmembrane component of general energizing module of ECF transporter [Catellicoccus marimammalium M35/04/3]
MNKMLLGRYVPGNSFMHRLDPRVKLLASIYFIILIFLCNNVWTYGVMFLVVALGITLSKIKWSTFFKGLKPVIGLILFTVLLQLLFSGGSEIYFQWGMITISKEGIQNAIFIFLRFVLIIFISTLLTLSTPSIAIADACESLLRPLEKLHVPVHEFALMLSIALRFVPTLMDETDKIMDAQRARGVEFDQGSLFQRIKAMVPLLIPLFVSSFNRAEELADAMEARCYQGGDQRTKYRALHWQTKDTWTIIFFILLCPLILWLGRL